MQLPSEAIDISLDRSEPRLKPDAKDVQVGVFVNLDSLGNGTGGPVAPTGPAL